MNDIIEKIYDSPEYKSKGKQILYKDVFICRKNNTWFVVFVMQVSDFDGKGNKYYYSVYNVNTHKVLQTDTDDYKKIVFGFPTLDSLDYNGGRMDFIQFQNQKRVISQLISTLDTNGVLDSDEISDYLEYLSTMNNITSDSVKKVYSFFKEEI